MPRSTSSIEEDPRRTRLGQRDARNAVTRFDTRLLYVRWELLTPFSFDCCAPAAYAILNRVGFQIGLRCLAGRLSRYDSASIVPEYAADRRFKRA